jgi:hypothetical protein
VPIRNRAIGRVLGGRGTLEPPLPIGLLPRFPCLRGLAARIVGIGIRPEHVRSPLASPPAA